MNQRNPSLSSLRVLLIALVAGLLLPTADAAAAAFDHDHAGYDAVLKRFVADGRVDYRGLKADSRDLDRYLDEAAEVRQADFTAWEPARQLAFLINLYNAATLKLILDHYPVRSIKDIGSLFKGPWSQPVVRLFGDTVTLDHLEHGIIRKQYREPRIHLALVCAAKGCPTLRREAYVAADLDRQLADQSRLYLSSPAGLRIDRDRKLVYFSSIFKWYGDDFVAGFSPSTGFSGLGQTERAVVRFAADHLGAADQEFLKAGGYAVKYLDYDWSLNDR